MKRTLLFVVLAAIVAAIALVILPRFLAKDPSLAARPAWTSVQIAEKKIACADSANHTQTVTSSGNYVDPVLSPDGNMVAFMRIVRPSTEPGDMADTEIWLGNCTKGASSVLAASRTGGDEPYGSFGNPIFSADGHEVYFNAVSGGDSPTLYATNIADRRTRRVAYVGLYGVIRNGPHRGDLVVNHHTCRPKGGCSYPYYVFHPDGAPAQALPSDSDRWTNKQLDAWLIAHGWRVS